MRPVWNSKWHISQILQPFQKSGYWWKFVPFKGGDFQTERTKEMQVFRHQNFQILWLDWIHIWCENILREGQTVHGMARDSNPRDKTELTRKIEGRGHKLYMDNFFSSPELFDDLAKKQIYCCGTIRPKRRRHATRPTTEDNKTEKGRNLHTDEYSRCSSER